MDAKQMTYQEAKSLIKKEGHANVTGNALTLVYAERLETKFMVNCMTIKSKKIYNWAIKYKIDLFFFVKRYGTLENLERNFGR